MALESKPLFHPEVLRQQVRAFNLPESVTDWQPKLQHWAGLIASGRADDFKETALLPDFFTDIFCGLLGYTGPASHECPCFSPFHDRIDTWVSRLPVVCYEISDCLEAMFDLNFRGMSF
jgi:hypothetical protein